MVDTSSVSSGDSVAVVEDEEVVVEGEVIDVREEDGGVTVKIREGETSVVEFWEKDTGASVTLGRRRDGGRLKPIPVADIAQLESK